MLTKDRENNGPGTLSGINLSGSVQGTTNLKATTQSGIKIFLLCVLYVLIVCTVRAYCKRICAVRALF